MNRGLGIAAFLLGLFALGWVGLGYVGSNPLALTMTALIAAFYLMGAVELHRFHQATASLVQALVAVPDNIPRLADWLARLHPSLQNPVRLRIEGERGGLPGPAMTPYLVGLLVLLGMLGTFLGMVVTLHGAVMALESTTDLPAIRAALAAPVKGLGLAFGTSVAGVAASAMLGLVSALCRRERLQAAQGLDTRIANELRVFSLAHQRQETLDALRLQARAMPEVADRLQAMMALLERQSQALNERTLASHDSFQRQAQAVYAELASAVDKSLARSLTEGARAAAQAMQPVVEATMAGIARESSLLQQGMADAVRLQLDGLSGRFGSSVTAVTEVWTASLARHERAILDLTQGLQQALQGITQDFGRGAASLLAALDQAHAALRTDLAAADRQRLAEWTRSLDAMARSLQRDWQQSGEQTLRQQQQICQTLEQTARDMQAQAGLHARDTIAEIAGLTRAAAEAPRAAAEVIAGLRQKLSDSVASDNALLEERSRIMATLATLLDAVNHATTEQRAAMDALVASSAGMLQQAGARFTATMEAGSAQLGSVAAQLGGSAVEVASLGEAFGFAVRQFGEASATLTTHLQRVEAALSKSTQRSDDQLAYYVAQARELIDLSIASQKQIVDDLQRIASRPLAGEVA